jgi:hypothetical protein
VGTPRAPRAGDAAPGRAAARATPPTGGRMTETADPRPAAAREGSPVDALHRMAGYREAEVPIIVRGEGCYLEDASGKRYLDALAGLFSVNIGYSYGDEIGPGRARADARACRSTRIGRTRTRGRSSSRRRSRRSRPATSTARSSSRVAPRRSSRPGSSPASTTSRVARSACARMSARRPSGITTRSPRTSARRAAATRRSHARRRTTARPSARSR